MSKHDHPQDYSNSCSLCTGVPVTTERDDARDAMALFATIEHGDAAHREWLRTELLRWFNGRQGFFSPDEVEQRVREAQDECARYADKRVADAIKIERQRCAYVASKRDHDDWEQVYEEILNPQENDYR